jgi:Ca2+-binding EF-hand superfamily protein
MPLLGKARAAVSLSARKDHIQDVAELHHIFTLLDADGDGEITHAEFIQGMRAHPELVRKLNVPQVHGQESAGRVHYSKAFAKMDTDNSHTVSFEEMLQYFAPHMLHGPGEQHKSKDEEALGARLSAVELARIFRVLDTDRDGELTMHEFRQGCRDYPELPLQLGLTLMQVGEEPPFSDFGFWIEEKGNQLWAGNRTVGEQQFCTFFHGKTGSPRKPGATPRGAGSLAQGAAPAQPRSGGQSAQAAREKAAAIAALTSSKTKPSKHIRVGPASGRSPPVRLRLPSPGSLRRLPPAPPLSAPALTPALRTDERRAARYRLAVAGPWRQA